MVASLYSTERRWSWDGCKAESVRGADLSQAMLGRTVCIGWWGTVPSFTAWWLDPLVDWFSPYRIFNNSSFSEVSYFPTFPFFYFYLIIKEQCIRAVIVCSNNVMYGLLLWFVLIKILFPAPCKFGRLLYLLSFIKLINPDGRIHSGYSPIYCTPLDMRWLVLWVLTGNFQLAINHLPNDAATLSLRTRFRPTEMQIGPWKTSPREFSPLKI